MKKPPLRAKAQKEGFSESGLPTSDVISSTVERVTPERKKDTIRSTGISQDGRERLNTMLRPDIKKKLSLDAIERRVSLAEILEEILLEHYNLQ
jgi:hypothetical protein